jgi:hypothetical protein
MNFAPSIEALNIEWRNALLERDILPAEHDFSHQSEPIRYGPIGSPVEVQT